MLVINRNNKKRVKMAIQLNTVEGRKLYLDNLMHEDSSKLKPIISKVFFRALEEMFNKKNVEDAVIGLYSQNEKTFAGVKDFKARIVQWIYEETTSEICPDDQKYVLNYVQLVNASRLFKQNVPSARAIKVS
jgi:hypothetical protein